MIAGLSDYDCRSLHVCLLIGTIDWVGSGGGVLEAHRRCVFSIKSLKQQRGVSFLQVAAVGNRGGQLSQSAIQLLEPVRVPTIEYRLSNI